MKPKVPGFTLFETLISIGILSLMLFGAVNLITQMLISTDHNKNVVTASYMLQECMELTRNLRDSLWKQNLDWDCAFGEGTYRIDSEERSGFDLADTCLERLDGESVYLYEVPDGSVDESFQIHWGEVEPYFYRKLQFADGLEEGSQKVSCEVWWHERGNREELKMSMQLTNWFKR